MYELAPDCCVRLYNPVFGLSQLRKTDILANRSTRLRISSRIPSLSYANTDGLAQQILLWAAPSSDQFPA
jgi:hypothetical protein